jgi:hypothetical protein
MLSLGLEPRWAGSTIENPTIRAKLRLHLLNHDGGISLFSGYKAHVDMVFSHCQIYRCCVEPSDFLIYIFDLSFIE